MRDKRNGKTSRRGFMLGLIAEKTPFDEVLERTEERFPQINFKQSHKNALSSILSQTGYTIPRTNSLRSEHRKVNLDHKHRGVIRSKGSQKLIQPLSRSSLILSLINHKPESIIYKYKKNDLLGKTPAEILHFSVDQTIKRAFHYESPSIRYLKWRWHKDSERLVEKISEVKSQQEFDELIISIGQSLVADWGSKNERAGPSKMNIGVAMKITNLVMKHLYFSGHIKNDSVLEWLHVPWDSFTLKPIRTIWQGYPPIPYNPSQGFVKDLDQYKELHGFISELATEAGVPRIYYEVYAWNQTHSE